LAPRAEPADEPQRRADGLAVGLGAALAGGVLALGAANLARAASVAPIAPGLAWAAGAAAALVGGGMVRALPPARRSGGAAALLAAGVAAAALGQVMRCACAAASKKRAPGCTAASRTPSCVVTIEPSGISTQWPRASRLSRSDQRSRGCGSMPRASSSRYVGDTS
jgi:hypothetical protein